MKKILQRIAIIVFIIALCTFILRYLSYITRPVDADPCERNIEAFHSLPENSVEVMMYGSSHGWRGVNNLLMYEKYGIGAYNYGGSWQNLSTEELFFYDSLQTQKPKVVLIETFLVSNTLYDVDMSGEIYYTRVMPDFPMKREYLRRAFAGDYKRYFTYYFPFAQFHPEWARLQNNNFVDYYTKEEFINTMGYFYMPYDDKEYTVSDFPDYRNFTQADIDEKAIEILDEIVATCKENNIEIVFYTIPWPAEYLFSDAMEKYAKENDCVYLDFYKLAAEIDLKNDDFLDIGHLNNNGASKVADYLGKYLSENYELTDMRTVPDNLWEGKYGNRTGYKWFDYNSLDEQ